VIVALGLLGVVMAVLAGAGNSMLFHADRARVQAVERNLVASGLAWARQHVQQPESNATAEPVQLDVSTFSIPQARLEVAFAPGSAGSVGVQIGATCSKGRQTVRSQRRYNVIRKP
jgi:hypothetical protein